MEQFSNKFQMLMVGDRGKFPYKLENDCSLSPEKLTAAGTFLSHLSQNGYAIGNLDILVNSSVESIQGLQDSFLQFIDGLRKEAVVLRHNFARSIDLQDYTFEDWTAVLAQYSLTYGWSDSFSSFTGENPDNVLESYRSLSDREVGDMFKIKGGKIFNVMDADEVVKEMIAILELNIPLRKTQLDLIKELPDEEFRLALLNSDITFKETAVTVMSEALKRRIEISLFKTPSDVVRFVAANYSSIPLEGQVTKSALKPIRLSIPTSVRKALLTNLDSMASSGKEVDIRAMAEDMMKFEDFWKRLDRFLSFTKRAVQRERYPSFYKAFDYLYQKDRSWTFNSRYEKAKAELDYGQAAEVLAERPGLLMRNLLELIRMSSGTLMPIKEGVVNRKEKRVINDAQAFFESTSFDGVLAKVPVKLMWQTFEELNKQRNYVSSHVRKVQGQVVRYTTPFPGLDSDLAKSVKKKLKKAIKNRQRTANMKHGTVYLDSDLDSLMLEYSGRKATETSFSGQYLSLGSRLSIEQLLEKSKQENAMLRLGCMWRGPSTDIDLSTTFLGMDGETVQLFYAAPVLKKERNVVGVSSGDITVCDKEEFSAEFIDINYNELKTMGFVDGFSAINVYRGSNLEELEIYFFASVISTAERVAPGGDVSIGLDKADYAIQINGEKGENAYFGLGFDFLSDELIILKSAQVIDGVTCHSLQGDYANLKEELATKTTLKKALKLALSKDSRTKDVSAAELIISTRSREELGAGPEAKILHPGRDLEEVQSLLF